MPEMMVVPIEQISPRQGRPPGTGGRRPLRVLVFAKAPVPGRVKTRLAGTIGARGAARLYRRLVERVLHVAIGAEVGPVELWGAPTLKHPFFLACRRRFGVRLRRQCDGDLGQRMDDAIRRTLAEGYSALVMGGDVPSVTVEDLRRARRLLDAGTSVVIGPAEDGGYVLIAMTAAHPVLFRRMGWGRADVLAHTRSRLTRADVNWIELSLRWDVDRPEDVRRWRRALGG
jgi:rSAM/selenodomain-associated transferase 1